MSNFHKTSNKQNGGKKKTTWKVSCVLNDISNQEFDTYYFECMKRLKMQKESLQTKILDTTNEKNMGSSSFTERLESSSFTNELESSSFTERLESSSFTNELESSSFTDEEIDRAFEDLERWSDF